MLQYESVIKAIVIIEKISILIVIILTMILTGMWLVSNLFS